MLTAILLAAPAAYAQETYRLLEQNGIWIEHFDAADSTKNRFTANNRLYPEGAKATYRYYFLGRGGKKYVQKVAVSGAGDREKAWKLVPLEERDSLANDRLVLIIESDLQGVDSTLYSYNHTPIRWEYTAPAGRLHFLERLSLVENEKNIWLHPPHARLFRILALNPHPFVQAPYAAGHAWQWQQQVSDHWGDARWREWKGDLSLHYQYRITGAAQIDTAFGKLNAIVVAATACSRLGTTSLTSWFHPHYGFLKLHYTNIDGSQLVLELMGKE